jgi:hypothetical protein
VTSTADAILIVFCLLPEAVAKVFRLEGQVSADPMPRVNGGGGRRNEAAPFVTFPTDERPAALTLCAHKNRETKMVSDYQEEKRAGVKQALAAWAILLLVMAAVQFGHLLW